MRRWKAFKDSKPARRRRAQALEDGKKDRSHELPVRSRSGGMDTVLWLWQFGLCPEVKQKGEAEASPCRFLDALIGLLRYLETVQQGVEMPVDVVGSMNVRALGEDFGAETAALVEPQIEVPLDCQGAVVAVGRLNLDIELCQLLDENDVEFEGVVRPADFLDGAVRAAFVVVVGKE